MEINDTPLGDITPYEQNARRITAETVEKVASSISEFGWRQPIVVDGEGVIIAGHVRYLAAKRLALKTVPVHVADDLTEQQVNTYRLADNRLHDETEWDFDVLGTVLGDLLDDETDLRFSGFDEDEVTRILTGPGTAFEPTLTPTTGATETTSADVERAQSNMEGRFSGNPDTIDVICPECALEFEISKQ
jgi:hypothetical protein